MPVPARESGTLSTRDKNEGNGKRAAPRLIGSHALSVVLCSYHETIGTPDAVTNPVRPAMASHTAPVAPSRPVGYHEPCCLGVPNPISVRAVCTKAAKLALSSPGVA